MDLVFVDLYECDHKSLLNADKIREVMLKAAELMGAEIVGDSFHTFKPWGVSGTVTIAESHIAIHTWPEYNFAAITFETCGNRMDHKKAYDFLINHFDAKRHEINYHKRGFMHSADAGLERSQVVG
ncbi:adenosylmethionine decarboxylase [Thermodesulfobacteriota bacterium]